MARIEYPDLAGAGPEVSALVHQIQQERGGRLLNLYRLLLHNPNVAAGWLRLGTAVRYESNLDGALRELAICRVARLTVAEYEWRAHRPLALREGVPAEQLDALDAWQESPLFDARQRAALAYTDAMTRLVQVDDETFAAVREQLSPRQIVELTVTIGFYNMVSRFLVAMAVDLETPP